MSKYRKIETEFRNGDTLRQALKDVCRAEGIEFDAGPDPHLYGYRGDRREQTAEYIIRRRFIGPSSNDMGYSRNEDGSYSLILSEFDSHAGSEGLRLSKEIKRRYARLEVERLAGLRGLRVREVSEAGGVTRLILVGRKTSQRRVQVRRTR